MRTEKHDFKVFEGNSCRIINGEEEHQLTCEGNGFEYCEHCGKAWNLTHKEQKEIWGE